jgi:hypothetical protein
VGAWSCFCGDEIGLLVIIPKGGTITAKRCIEILKKHFILFYKRIKGKYGNQVVMQEDNTPWHKAKSLWFFLTRQKVKFIS